MDQRDDVLLTVLLCLFILFYASKPDGTAASYYQSADQYTYGTTPPLPQNRYPAATGNTNYYANQPATAPVLHQYPSPPRLNGVNGQYTAAAVYPPMNTGYPMYPGVAGQGVTTPYYQHPTGYVAATHSPRSHSNSYNSHHRSSHSSTFSFSHTPSRSLSEDTVSSESASVQLLQRCDGTLISPHTDPSTVIVLTQNGTKLDELTFTAGDDALFGNNMVTVISVNWTTPIPFGTVRMHTTNRIYHVPLMDLVSMNNMNHFGRKSSVHSNGGRNSFTGTCAANGHNGPHNPAMNRCNSANSQVEGAHCTATNGLHNGHNGAPRHQHGRYRINSAPAAGQRKLGLTTSNPDGVSEELRSTIEANIGALISRRNPKLSDETLMKLPHLRKHREYIRTIDATMGPRDYNSYRVSVHSQDGNGNAHNGVHNDGNNNGNMMRRHRGGSHCVSENDNVDGNGRTANIQNLSAKPRPADHAGTHDRDRLNARKRAKRMTACEKGDLFKTELCENWVKKGHCTYGKKCHFAHGREDIRTRWRIENYKTQPCCDPARADSRLCLFGKRCNYAHPGEPLRRSHHCLYLDEEYEAEISKDFGSDTQFPFGIYI